jgi:hypothetical protein
MTTFADIKNDVLIRLVGFADSTEQLTTVSQGSSMGVSDTTVVVADATKISTGLVQFENELVLVKSIDRNTSIVSIIPGTRGYYGTTPASHANDSLVTNNPQFPRGQVGNLINEVILQLFPQIFWPKVHTFNFEATRINYPMPSDAEYVINVTWPPSGPTQIKMPVRRWRVEQRLESDSTPLGLEILGSVEPGRTVRVLYAAKPTVFAADADTLASRGLEESAKDVLVYGACSRALNYLDAGRTSSATTPDGLAMTGQVPIGSATNTGRTMYALFQQRFNEERARLVERYRPQWHRSE